MAKLLSDEELLGGAGAQSSAQQRLLSDEDLAAPPTSQADAPGMVSNAARNAAGRGLTLAGNYAQFGEQAARSGESWLRELTGVNPGLVMGGSEDLRARGYEPDLNLGGFGLDFTMDVDPRDIDRDAAGVLGNVGQSLENADTGYVPRYTVDQAMDDFSLANWAGAVAEQGPAAVVDMGGMYFTPAAYLGSRTQEITEERVSNDNRSMDDATLGDYAAGGATAAAVQLIDRLALGKLLPGGGGQKITRAAQIPGRVGRDFVREGTTEAIQGGLENLGATLGTETGTDGRQLLRAAIGEAMIGGPVGSAVGGVSSVVELRRSIRDGLEAQGVDTSQVSDEDLDAEVMAYLDQAESASQAATPEQTQAAVERGTGTDAEPPITDDQKRYQRTSELASVFEEGAPVQRRSDLETDPDTGEATIPEGADPLRDRSGTQVTADQLANNRQAEGILQDQGMPADPESVRTMATYLERGLSPREAINAFTRASRSGEFREVPLERDSTAKERREQFAGEAFDVADARRKRYESGGRRGLFPRDTRAGAADPSLQQGVAPQDPNNPWVPSQEGIQAAQQEGRISEDEASRLSELRDLADTGMVSEQEVSQRAMQILFPDDAPTHRMRQELEDNARRVPRGVNEGQPGQPRDSVDRTSTTQPGDLGGEFLRGEPTPNAPQSSPQGRDVTQPGEGLPNRGAPTADAQNTPRMDDRGAATADNQRPDQSARAPVRAGEQVTAYRPDGTPAQVTVQDVQDNGDVRVRHSDGSEQMIGDELSLQRPPEAATGANPDRRGDARENTDRRETRPEVRDAVQEELDSLPAEQRQDELARLREENARLKQQLQSNPLTGLPNLVAFEEDANLGWPHVGAMDMDGMGWFNDTWGHQPTDNLLRAVGREIKAVWESHPLRDKIKVYHRSGDEFAMRSNATKAETEAFLDEVQTALDQAQVTVEGVSDTGETVVYETDGLGFTYGLSSDYERADHEANKSKARRQEQGLRAAKGTEPVQVGRARAARAERRAGESDVSEKGTDDRSVEERSALPRREGVSQQDVISLVEERNRVADLLEGGSIDPTITEETHLFDPPAESEKHRLIPRAKNWMEENNNGEYLTEAEAEAKLQEWKDHAVAQGKDPEQRSRNSQRVVLSLFDYSGTWAQPWRDAGYEVVQFDTQLDEQLGDINNFSVEFFQDNFGDFEGKEVHAVLAACPCTVFSTAGNKHIENRTPEAIAGSIELVDQTMRTIERFRPAVWSLENPISRIRKMTGLPPWRVGFDPWVFGAPYTKKTYLWGRMNGDLPLAPVYPKQGSKMHSQYGGGSIDTKNARSETPESFAYAYFMANNAEDNLAMTVQNRFDQVDPDLIQEALDADMSEAAVEEALTQDDGNYYDQDFPGAESNLRDAVRMRRQGASEADLRDYYEDVRRAGGREAFAERERADAEETRRNDPPADEVIDSIGRDPEREAADAARQQEASARESAEQANTNPGQVTTDEGLTYDAGTDGTVVTPDGTEVEYTWALVEPESLVVSQDPESGRDNPEYPADLQPRDRKSAASTAQVRDIANRMDTRLLQDSTTTDAGAPIVGPDGVVESGNGRTLAILQARPGKYNTALLDLESKGLAGADPSGKILVRVRKTPMDQKARVAFARESNKRTSMNLSTTEQAKIDAESIEPIIGQFQGGDVAGQMNRQFVRDFIRRAVSPQEQAGFLKSDGTLSADGRRRIQAAVFQAAYGDSDLVSEIFESTDTDIKALGNALLEAAGWWGDMRNSVTQEGGRPELDLTEGLLGAVRLVQEARRSRQSLTDLMNQGDMVSGSVSDQTRKMVEVLYKGPNLKRARSQRAVAQTLIYYATDAALQGSSYSMFDDVSADQLMEGAIKEGDLKAGGGGATQGPQSPVNVKLYGGIPLDAMAAAIKRVIGIEAIEFRHKAEQVGVLLESAKEALRGVRGKERLTNRSIIADMWRVTFATLDGDMRMLAKKFDSPTLQGLADKFHAMAGGDAGVTQTFDEAVQSRNRRLQHVDRIVSIMRDLHAAARKAGSKATLAEREAMVIRMVENPKLPRRGATGELVRRIETFLKEEIAYLRDAGVELGEVKDGYFPREMDQGKAAMQPDLFVKQATKAYKEMGLSDDNAAEAANAYWESVVYGASGKPGAIRPASQTPKFTQARIFTKEAARHLEGFRVTDIDAVLGQYTMRATKRAEIARRFGDNWSRWEEIEAQILKEDPTARDIMSSIRDRVALSAGVRLDSTSHGARVGLSILRTWTTLATLPKSAMASLGELVVAPIRGSTGNIPQDMAATVTNILGHGRNMAQWMTGMGRSEATQALFELAEDIGIIAGTGHNSLMAARFAGGDPVGKIQSTVLAEFFKRNMLEYLTNYTRVTSMRVGQTFIRRLAKQMDGSPKKSSMFLRELGVPKGKEADFAKWIRDMGPDLPGVKDISGPYAGIYRNALQRFTDQTVMRPSNSTRPKWAAHPLGAVVFQLQAFGYAFQKNVLNRTVRIGMNQDLSALEKVAFSASMLSGFALLTMLQGLVRFWRDEIYNEDINDRKTDWAFVEGALSQAGMFGVADPYMQSLSGVRYQKNPAQVLLGPALGGLSDASGDFMAGMLANSPNTNTSERNMAKSAYDWLMEPLAQSLLTAAPGGPVTGKLASAATIYAVPKGRDPFADVVAGPPETQRSPPIMGALEFLLNGAAPSGGARSDRDTRRADRPVNRARESSR